MIVNIDISMLHDELVKQLSLYHVSAASPSAESSEKITRPPLLTQESLPLLQTFYLAALHKISSRLQAWITDVKVADSTVSIAILENSQGSAGKPAAIPESWESMIGETIRYVCELYVLSEVYASYDCQRSEKFAEQMEDMIGLLLELFAMGEGRL